MMVLFCISIFVFMVVVLYCNHLKNYVKLFFTAIKALMIFEIVVLFGRLNVYNHFEIGLKSYQCI